MKKTALLLAAATSAAAAWSMPALAQETEQPQAQAYVENGDIIVTARKRQESILKVPVVETVLSAETLSKAQVVDVAGISRQVPGLQIGGNVLTVGTQIALRGVGTSSLDAGVDQSVSINIDGLQLTQGASYSVGVFDMQQIEVLKGPQALFFGKNSPGGVIAIRTADPGEETELVARAIYGVEAKEKRGELIYSAPISDTVGLRIAGMYSEDDGYFFNRATAAPGFGGKTPRGRYNAGEEYILRGTLVWNPSDDVNVRLKVNNTRKKIIGGGAPLGSCPDGVGSPLNIPFINPADTCKVDRIAYIVDVDPAAFPDARNNGTPFMRYLTTFGTLEVNYNVTPHITFTSTSGFYNNEVDGFINGTNTGSAGPSLTSDNQFHRRDYTQEFRLQSDFPDSPVDFLIGGFYQDGQVSNRVFVAGNTAIGLPRTLLAGINDVSIKALSCFGQLRWHPSDQIEIAAGVRYTDEKRHDDASSVSSFFATPTPITLLKPNLRSKNWSPELTVTYTPTDDLTIFGALKQGYKSGSFIMTVPAAPNSDNSFGDERVRGGEVGVKSRLADRSLNVNAAFYYYKYADLQVGANEQASGGIPIIRTINAASSKVYGVDFDMAYTPPSVPGLTARLAINWNRAHFTSFGGAPCYGGQRISDGCNQNPLPIAPGTPITDTTKQFAGQDLSGAPLPKAAEWMITGGLDYEMPVGDDLQLELGLNAQYSSKFLRGLGRFDGVPGITQPAYTKINANIGFGPADEAWQFSVIGNNLTDKFTAGNCTTFSASTGQVLLPTLSGAVGRNAAGLDELACIPERGREVFVRFSVKFNGF
jgi:iron complex outermembrane receptor protein